MDRTPRLTFDAILAIQSTMNKHDLPDIACLSGRIEADNKRVLRYLDRLPQRVDSLVEALQQTDLNEVRRLSEYLADASDDAGCDTVSYRAERVCEELKKPNNLRGVKRSVVRLIGACGSVRRAKKSDARVE